MSRRPLDYGWWLLSRASGTVALLLVTVCVLMGLLMASGLARGSWKRSLISLHEHTALVALISIAVHGIALLGDTTLHPGLLGILVPYQMPYRPTYVAIGMLSGYMTAALALSFYARRRIGGGRWRRLHRWTVLAYVLGVAHAMGAGSDAGSEIVRLGVLASVLPAAGLFLLRNRPKPARKAGAAGAARKPALADTASAASGGV